MATKDAVETNGCTFLWRIENLSQCFLKKGERIESPVFTVDTLEDTKWSLWLYPLGDSAENDAIIYLNREQDSDGLSCLQVNYQLALMNEDGSILSEKALLGIAFLKNYRWSCYNYEALRKIFVTERKAFSPEDPLTVQCTIWRKSETPIKPRRLSARTIFKLNRKSFVWKIDEFSTLKPGVRNKFKDDLIEFDLVFNGLIDFVKKLDVDIISFYEGMKHFAFKLSVINSEGTEEECAKGDYFADDLKMGVYPIPLFSKMLLENKTRYLPKDELSLVFEYLSSNGTFLHEVSIYGMIAPKRTKAVGENAIPQPIPVLMNDLRSAYEEGMFGDTELRTSTRKFQAHRFILGARSPVFSSMFSNDMKEKNSGRVDVTDLEDDTVQRMLTYMYTDSLGDMQFENAYRLYAAADKYEILSLRIRCSSFLKDNLCPTKACDVLALADRHQDVDLKSVVQSFIADHAKEVFGSQEWRHFMASNSELAADIMYRKLFPG